jgi:hypothetical protein
MRTKLENVEQFQEWFMNLSKVVKLREINKALDNHRVGVLYTNTDDELRSAIQGMFGNDVLEVYRKSSHHIRVYGEPLIYVDYLNERIIGVGWDWEDIDYVVGGELFGGWEALAESMDVIFDE